ncbi:ATP-dependent RNA helicase HrpB [Thalassovita gelatinovora]|uniref:ATP-dependent RNA helicase HrpB n=1 Tax=Thalassovita gelatinovora TaxID=53501 RepID=A0A0P1FDY6_THAGE|nr:ATP-dependent helicase HrpB [Thalassovita gelatinovora]QIZ80559.1 ATP-dependent helicase HrpB [Thalassovita gelatinovora]CUH66052.1 ATP-dependent RNA helicase HrpB [Thalassovita gelatinovora]SEQ76156.1 ATP-dependent helicase HrpB [Thalassovita gelatinovora]
MTTLPIHSALPDLLTALTNRSRAVLQAPPGAGKTTVVPLTMLEAGLTTGRILMLEPRRLAARAAAERMAQTLGEPVGQTVGYRIRGDAKISKSTRIEVVTEGILTRMIQSDAELSGIGAVIFDEFHERSLNADLGLALCLEIAEALRDDLILLAMSATLDAGPVAALMGDVPVITSQGRAFPVDIRWLDRPLGPKTRLEEATATLIQQAVSETEGGVLVFLPGEGEIRRTEALLKGRLPTDCDIRPLFGAMEFGKQRAAIEPAKSGRKVVLATSIAETSLTIQDVRVVVDAGRARRARFDPGSGMSRLVTEKVTKAEATQRTGRAGRVAEGQCYRLWTKGEEGGLQPFPPAEIETADLAGLALELALWGASPSDLALLTAPNPGAFAEARSLLRMLQALDAQNRITDHGRALAALPLHPRLAHMLTVAGPDAAVLAALLADRDPLARSAPVDLSLRLSALRDLRGYTDRHPFSANRGAIERIKSEAKRLAKRVKPDRKGGMSDAEMAALAYPDRIGLRRKGDAARYILSGGKGAVMDDHDPLAGARLIVATDLDGNPREARIRQAIQINEAELRGLFADQIGWIDHCEWSRRDRRVIARTQEKLGAVVLDDRIWKDAPPEAIARAMLDGVRDLGLVPSDAAKRFIARVKLVRDAENALPDMSDPALMDSLEDWLLPHLSGVKTAEGWKKFDLLNPLRAMLDWTQMQVLDRAAPAHFTTPLGRQIPIDYSGEVPEISLRLQEMFGQTSHPMVGRTPLKVTLLSPARRPVQTTMDIPGFWASSYADVRKDMRGKYPKHPWPEDPTQADPTLRAKPRGR